MVHISPFVLMVVSPFFLLLMALLCLMFPGMSVQRRGQICTSSIVLNVLFCGILLLLGGSYSTSNQSLQLDSSIQLPLLVKLMLGSLQGDLFGGFWCLVSSLAALFILSWPRDSVPSSTASPSRGSSVVLMALAASQLAVMASSIWVQWMAAIACGWFVALLLNRSPSLEQRDQRTSSFGGSYLVLGTLADSLWFLGLLGIQSVSRTPFFVELAQIKNVPPEDSATIAMLVSSLSLILMGLMIRCGLFPFMSWTRSALRTTADSAWITCLGLGTFMMLLFRWHPLLTAFDESRMILAGIGAFSALLLAITVWSEPSRPDGMFRLAAAQCAVIWMGLGALGELHPFWVLLVWSLILLWPVLSLALENSSITGRSGNGRIAIWMIILFLSCGLWGQEIAFDSLKSESAPKQLPPMVLAAVALLGHGLAVFLLFRRVLSPVSTESVVISETDSKQIKIRLFASLIAAAGSLAFWFWVHPSQVTLFVIPVMTLLALMISLVAAVTWKTAATAKEENPLGLSGSLRRVGRLDFYIPLVIENAIVKPLWGGARVFTFLIHFAISQGILQNYRLWWGDTVVMAERVDEESTDWASAIFLCLAAAAMIGSWWLFQAVERT